MSAPLSLTRAQAAHARLVARLAADEGFRVAGDFADWQGGGELVAVRHHRDLRRSVAVCTLPLAGDALLKQVCAV